MSDEEVLFSERASQSISGGEGDDYTNSSPQKYFFEVQCHVVGLVN